MELNQLIVDWGLTSRLCIFPVKARPRSFLRITHGTGGTSFYSTPPLGFFSDGMHCEEDEIKWNLKRFFPGLNQEGLQRNALVVPSATVSTSNK